MAITETRQYREPFVEAAGLGVTNEGLRLLGQTLPTSTYTGSAIRCWPIRFRNSCSTSRG